MVKFMFMIRSWCTLLGSQPATWVSESTHMYLHMYTLPFLIHWVECCFCTSENLTIRIWGTVCEVKTESVFLLLLLFWVDHLVSRPAVLTSHPVQNKQNTQTLPSVKRRSTRKIKDPITKTKMQNWGCKCIILTKFLSTKKIRSC